MSVLVCVFLFFSMGWPAFAQHSDTVSLAYCHQRALEKSPLQQQKLLSESIARLQAQSFEAQNRPQFQVSGQYTYQSDVFGLPFEMPGANTPEIPKNQYQVNVEVQQKLFDGGKVKYGKEQALLNQQISQQQTEVSLFQIKEIINQLYFSALLLQENEAVLRNTVVADLTSRIAVVDARVKNGVALKSMANQLRIELLRTEQQLQELEASKTAILEMLVQWTEDERMLSSTLSLPSAMLSDANGAIIRPEYKLFEQQTLQLDIGKSLVHAASLPQFSAFGRAGLGNPNPFNFFEVGDSPFYLVGVKFEWRPFNYGTYRREKEVLTLQQNIIAQQKANFDKNIALQLTQEQSAIKKAQALLARDAPIIQLQEEVVAQLAAQLENGVVTSTEYVTELNALTRARINQKLHEIQLRQAQINWLTKRGEF